MDRQLKIAKKRTGRNRWNLKDVNKRGRPRLSVHRTVRHISAQVIDDLKGVTLCAFSTQSKEFKGSKSWDVAAAAAVGEQIAKLALEKKIKDVVFDRGGYYYHGRVKALADGARKGGLNF
ncbi:MAG: 50S ribosomal protein L18 [Rickettsiales bacterium]|jgi:large subunit ribosomal protein L18|nr:50S ribosomal protein L18 [Rickettsiales bacterium]